MSGVAFGLAPGEDLGWEVWEVERRKGMGKASEAEQSQVCFHVNSHFVLYSDRLRVRAR